MDKNVRPYKQRGDTCAIACMMMTLEYYGLIKKANWYDERRFYKIYGSDFMSGTPFSALAYHFSKNGLDTTIFHSNIELFNNDKNTLNKGTYDSALDEYKRYLNQAKKHNTKIINGINIDSKFIRCKLEEGNIIILAGQNSSGGYHSILVSGYEDSKFIVCNPRFKSKQYMSFDEINKFINTDIGKWFIAVNNNSVEKNDHSN